ncbi:MAG TPA: MlaD family protein [Candidatus Omnitrophota bacterium]|nr:MlaD family protein [Candidatus Omnitrophota bacterium]
MSEKKRYFKIGLFTLISMVFLCAGLIMFGAGSYFQAPPLIAETYFTESVQGLDAGALVKMNGVKVGKVKDILFVKDIYGRGKSITEMNSKYTMVYVTMEIESQFFPGLKGKSKSEVQTLIDLMVKEDGFRAKLQSIGITGLVYVELGFYNPDETPPPMQFSWEPLRVYIPSAPGVATRLGESLDKLLNKMDTDIYPMIENINKASKELPPLVAKLNDTMPHLEVIAKNVADITSTGKKYPSQMIFGEAPSKSRYDR